MSLLLGHRSVRLLWVVPMFTLMGLMAAPGVAAAATPLDTVNVTGATSNGELTNINVSAQSGTSGQNPSGTASAVYTPLNLRVSGPVLCLSVTGPDSGAGTSAAPTTATFNFQPAGTFPGVTKVMVVDNGGNGTDQIAFFAGFQGSPTDCSPIAIPVFSLLAPGRAVVFDAPTLPTSKNQCKHGGWQSFGVFKNQGDCVSFVVTHGNDPPG